MICCYLCFYSCVHLYICMHAVFYPHPHWDSKVVPSLEILCGFILSLSYLFIFICMVSCFLHLLVCDMITMITRRTVRTIKLLWSVLFWDVMHHIMAVPYWYFRTTHRPHLQGSSSMISWPLKIGWKHQKGVTTICYIISQKRTALINFMVEAWNHHIKLLILQFSWTPIHLRLTLLPCL